MVELQISLRLQGESDLKKRGEVLLAKLPGSPWSERERCCALIVERDDADLEAKVQARRQAGEKHPVIVHPYATTDDEGEIIKRSTLAVNIDAMETELKQRVLNDRERVETLSPTQYTTIERS